LAEDLQRELPRLELVWANGAYTGGFREWLEEERGWRVEVPRHRDRQLWRYGLEEKPRGSSYLWSFGMVAPSRDLACCSSSPLEMSQAKLRSA
jgi:hypothetical protein